MELEEVSVPEILPGYSRRIFTKRDKAIIEDIKNFQPCTLFKETYIQYALSAFKRGIVYYHGSTLQGFAIWIERKTRPLNMLANAPLELPCAYIDILLISAIGQEELSRILYGIERYGIKHSIVFIQLLPGPDIDFYKKQGYSFESSIFQSTMVKGVEPLTILRTQNTRRNSD